MILGNNIINNIKTRHSGLKTLNMNFGPNHPAAHGVLRLSLDMEGEIIKNTDIHIGLLHRGTEKLIEDRPYLLSIPYFDRLDYVSMMLQEHGYCLAIEKLNRIPNFDQKITKTRTIFDELTRILNHLLAIACHALDVGSMSPLFWAFEERECIMGFYENVSGARMHAAYYKPGTTKMNIPTSVLEDILVFLPKCQKTLNEVSGVLTENRIWKERLIGIGTYGYKESMDYGLTGVMARCTGLKKDLRFNKRTTYGSYYFSNSKSFITLNGDSLDRYLIRMQEMSESLLIVNKAILNTKHLDKARGNRLAEAWLAFRKKPNENLSMEETIKHFKLWSSGLAVEKGITSQYVESPKGEFGVTLLSDGTNKPYRCKIRSPAYNHIQFLPKLVKNKQLADLITIIGTIDIVFGEIDR